MVLPEGARWTHRALLGRLLVEKHVEATRLPLLSAWSTSAPVAPRTRFVFALSCALVQLACPFLRFLTQRHTTKTDIEKRTSTALAFSISACPLARVLSCHMPPSHGQPHTGRWCSRQGHDGPIAHCSASSSWKNSAWRWWSVSLRFCFILRV